MDTNHIELTKSENFSDYMKINCSNVKSCKKWDSFWHLTIFSVIKRLVKYRKEQLICQNWYFIHPQDNPWGISPLQREGSVECPVIRDRRCSCCKLIKLKVFRCPEKFIEHKHSLHLSMTPKQGDPKYIKVHPNLRYLF